MISLCFVSNKIQVAKNVKCLTYKTNLLTFKPIKANFVECLLLYNLLIHRHGTPELQKQHKSGQIIANCWLMTMPLTAGQNFMALVAKTYLFLHTKFPGKCFALYILNFYDEQIMKNYCVRFIGFLP
jgi:hypothetical protein